MAWSAIIAGALSALGGVAQSAKGPGSSALDQSGGKGGNKGGYAPTASAQQQLRLSDLMGLEGPDDQRRVQGLVF